MKFMSIVVWGLLVLAGFVRICQISNYSVDEADINWSIDHPLRLVVKPKACDTCIQIIPHYTDKNQNGLVKKHPKTCIVFVGPSNHQLTIYSQDVCLEIFYMHKHSIEHTQSRNNTIMGCACLSFIVISAMFVIRRLFFVDNKRRHIYPDDALMVI